MKVIQLNVFFCDHILLKHTNKNEWALKTTEVTWVCVTPGNARERFIDLVFLFALLKC